MLQRIDMLGPVVNFKINGHNILKSNFGGFITLLLFILSVGAFIGFGRDLFLRENPIVLFNKLENDSPSYTITDMNFLFAVYDQFSDLGFEEFERKFVGYMEYYEYMGDGTNNDGSTDPNNNHFFEKCSPEALAKWDGYFYNDKSLYFCLPKNTTLNIKGIFNEGAHSAVRMQIMYCFNNTDSTQGPIRTNCYDRNFIERNITGRIQMHYIFSSSKIDSGNYVTPGTFIPVTGLTNTNVNTWNRLTVNFINSEVDTNTGWFLAEWYYQIYNRIESIVSESVYSPGTDTIFSHLMGNYKYKEVYRRDYIKIQNIFALMGGFVTATVIIMRFIIAFTSRPSLVDIFNKIFRHFEFLNDSKSIINKERIIAKDDISTISGVTRLKNNFIIGLDNTSSPIRIDSIVETYKEKISKNYEMKFDFCTKIFRLCLFRTKNYEYRKLFYSRIEKKMSNILSIEHFIKMSRNITFLKYLLLENYQNQLLKVCQTDTIKEKLTAEKISQNLLDDICKKDNVGVRISNLFFNK